MLPVILQQGRCGRKAQAEDDRHGQDDDQRGDREDEDVGQRRAWVKAFRANHDGDQTGDRERGNERLTHREQADGVVIWAVRG